MFGIRIALRGFLKSKQWVPQLTRADAQGEVAGLQTVLRNSDFTQDAVIALSGRHRFYNDGCNPHRTERVTDYGGK